MLINSDDLRHIIPTKYHLELVDIHLEINEEVQEYDFFDMKQYVLYLILHPDNITSNDNIEIFDKLCKKIDVHKNLFKSYSVDLRKNTTNTSVDKHTLYLLVIIYLAIAQKEKNIKFLNTGLKLLDGSILSKVRYPKFLSSWAIDLLKELI